MCLPRPAPLFKEKSNSKEEKRTIGTLSVFEKITKNQFKRREDVQTFKNRKTNIRETVPNPFPAAQNSCMFDVQR